MSSYFNVRIHNMSLCDLNVHISYKTYRYVDSMLGFQCKYNIRIFTLKKRDILT